MYVYVFVCVCVCVRTHLLPPLAHRADIDPRARKRHDDVITLTGPTCCHECECACVFIVCVRVSLLCVRVCVW